MGPIRMKAVAPHILMVLISILYVAIGAAIVYHYCRPLEKNLKELAIADIVGQINAVEVSLRHNISMGRNLTQELNNLIIGVITQAKRYRIKGDELYSAVQNESWSYSEALVFAFSLVTTISSGTITPESSAGRVFCIFYGLIGVPILMMSIANMGKFLGTALALVSHLITARIRCWLPATNLYSTYLVRSRHISGERRSNGPPKVSVSLLLITFCMYIVVGAALLPQYGGTDMITSCYFCFVSLTTVGVADNAETPSVIPTLFYLIIGLALTTVALEVAAVYLQKIHYLGRELVNVRHVLIQFGSRMMTVGDLVLAIGRHFNIPEGNLLELNDNLDSFVHIVTTKGEKLESFGTPAMKAFTPRALITHVETDEIQYVDEDPDEL